ncbi:hypothetical protein AH67_07080 [Bifidobacterium pseudolongum PV8-2]|uniref:Uncharacterized protein n=1 Tax=Bifidobacterium pseudolongum PV8-2 TaxID=1447715 RepID=A0A0A7IA18_9BIFI|nr:hypothetical protein AH67_07080 [Bifidobacterium pseudolongum PV8-2]
MQFCIASNHCIDQRCSQQYADRFITLWPFTEVHSSEHGETQDMCARNTTNCDTIKSICIG